MFWQSIGQRRAHEWFPSGSAYDFTVPLISQQSLWKKLFNDSQFWDLKSLIHRRIQGLFVSKWINVPNLPFVFPCGLHEQRSWWKNACPALADAYGSSGAWKEKRVSILARAQWFLKRIIETCRRSLQIFEKGIMTLLVWGLLLEILAVVYLSSTPQRFEFVYSLFLLIFTSIALMFMIWRLKRASSSAWNT